MFQLANFGQMRDRKLNFYFLFQIQFSRLTLSQYLLITLQRFLKFLTKFLTRKEDPSFE